MQDKKWYKPLEERETALWAIEEDGTEVAIANQELGAVGKYIVFYEWCEEVADD